MFTMWPQLAVAVLMVLGLGISLAQHGDAKTGYESFWTSLASSAVMFWLLYEGGFFNIIPK